MGTVHPFPASGGAPQVGFDRRELNRIVDLYGRMVTAGLWRDYAIDFARDHAAFSELVAVDGGRCYAIAYRILRDAERAVAADGDDRVDAEVARVRDQLVRPVDVLVTPVRLQDRVVERAAAVRRAEDRPAEVADAAHRLARHGDHLVLAEQPGEATLDAEYVPPTMQRREHGGANHRVQARGVTAASGESYAHGGKVMTTGP